MVKSEQPATMGDMDRITLDALPAPLREGLRQLAADPSALPEVPDPFSETPEQAAERRHKAAVAKAARWRDRLPRTYAEASLDDLAPEHRDPIRHWLQTRSALNLVLAGDVGVGKTHAAYAIGNWAVERGHGVEAWHVHDLLEAMRPDGDRYAYERACRVPLLVLDDMGAVKPTDWARDQMVALMNARVAAEKRTVLTTNVASEVMATLWEHRLMDRLNEGLVSVVFKGASRRKAAW